MAKVYDVPADALIERLGGALKQENIPVPSWAPFVKTGSHADKPPQSPDWWYARCASLLRKIYLRGPIGVNQLRKAYGGSKPSGYGRARHRPAGGAIIRNAIQEMEKMGYVAKAERGGRILTKEGMKKLDGMATEILGGLAQKDPAMKVYR